MRPRASIIGAMLLAALGLAFGARALYQPRRAPTPAPPSEPTGPPLPLFSLKVNPEFETRVSPENLSEVVERVGERVAGGVRAAPTVSALGHDMTSRLIEASKEQATIYFGGSFDAHREFIRRSGGSWELVSKAADPESKNKAMDTLRAVWEATVSTVANHPISLDEITVRLRYKEGKGAPLPDDKYLGAVVTVPDRWPAFAGDPVANGYTIVEALIPVFYVYAPQGSPSPINAPAYLGWWFVWDQHAKDWKIHQLRLYSPMRVQLSVCPVF